MSESAPSPSTPDPSKPADSPGEPAALFDPNLFPSRHRPFRQWLLDHNPLLLLSTVFMLLGCYLVNSALPDRDNGWKVLLLLLVINVYEACIIPLGLVLIRRTRGTARDGWWLLLFEVLFLVNATFINVDFRSTWGIPLNLLLFALACVKAAIVMRGLKIGLSLRTYGFFVLQLACVYGLPILFAVINTDGVVPPAIMSALWWLLVLLPVIYDQIAGWDERRHPTVPGIARWDLVQNVVRRVYLITPWVLLAAHLRYAHWAHDSAMQLANYAPLLLGLTLATARLPREHTVRAFAKILPVIAALLSLSADTPFPLSLGEQSITLQPFHFTFAAAFLTYGYLASPLAFLCTLAAIVLAAMAYLFQAWIRMAFRWLGGLLADLIPTTMLSWGVTTIVLAFVLLAFGSILSLRRTALESPRQDP